MKKWLRVFLTFNRLHTFIIALGFPGGLSFGLNFLPLVQSQLVLTFWHNLWLHIRKVFILQYNAPFTFKSHQSISVSSKGNVLRLNPLIIDNEKDLQRKEFRGWLEGCDTFGPKRIWSPDIWSPTIGPQLIGPAGQTVLNQFSPHGEMLPKNLVPMDKWSSTNLVPINKWFLE